MELKDEVAQTAASFIQVWYRSQKKLRNNKKQNIFDRINFDNKKKAFSNKMSDYKNSRGQDEFYPIFRALIELELQIEKIQKLYKIEYKLTEDEKI